MEMVITETDDAYNIEVKLDVAMLESDGGGTLCLKFDTSVAKSVCVSEHMIRTHTQGAASVLVAGMFAEWRRGLSKTLAAAAYRAIIDLATARAGGGDRAPGAPAGVPAIQVAEGVVLGHGEALDDHKWVATDSQGHTMVCECGAVCGAWQGTPSGPIITGR